MFLRCWENKSGVNSSESGLQASDFRTRTIKTRPVATLEIYAVGPALNSNEAKSYSKTVILSRVLKEKWEAEEYVIGNNVRRGYTVDKVKIEIIKENKITKPACYITCSIGLNRLV